MVSRWDCKMIVGLTGKKQSGKDTVADYLVENYNFQKVGFSDVMYEAVAALWGITVEEALAYKYDGSVSINLPWNGEIPSNVLRHNFTWREHLQRFGTDMGREVFGKDFWVEAFDRRYLNRWPSELQKERLVIRDVRFNNEASLIRSQFDSFIWQIVRDDLPDDPHESEAGIDVSHITAWIDNNDTIEALYELVDRKVKVQCQI